MPDPRHIPLPPRFSWGKPCGGDYYWIAKDGEPFCRFGGLYLKVTPAEAWPGLIPYALAKAEKEQGAI